MSLAATIQVPERCSASAVNYLANAGGAYHVSGRVVNLLGTATVLSAIRKTILKTSLTASERAKMKVRSKSPTRPKKFHGQTVLHGIDLGGEARRSRRHRPERLREDNVITLY